MSRISGAALPPRYQRRAPKRNGGFSWGRYPTGATAFIPGTEYRLFRREHSGRVHAEMQLFAVEVDRSYIARRLLAMRHELRNRVDTIDLAAMGVTE